MAQHEVISFGGMEVKFCLDENDTTRQLTMFEVTVQAGTKMPAPHYHKDFDETVYGLEGIVTYTVDGKEVLVGPGVSCFIPRGIVHGFANRTDDRIKFLAFASPGVFGPSYFNDIAAVLNAGGPPDIAKIKEVMSKYGLVPVMG